MSEEWPYFTCFCSTFYIFWKGPSLLWIPLLAEVRCWGPRRGPQLWNSLPRVVYLALILDVFRKNLKIDLHRPATVRVSGVALMLFYFI